MMLLVVLLLQAAAVRADPVAAGSAVLKQSIVDAIRNCPTSVEGEVRVCSRDRGYAEGSGYRLPKITKPVAPVTAPAVTVKVEGQSADGCSDPRGCRRAEADERIDAATRARLTRPRR